MYVCATEIKKAVVEINQLQKAQSICTEKKAWETIIYGTTLFG